MKGIKQTSIVVILTILLASTPACRSVKVLPVERPVTETGIALTAQVKFNSQYQDIADSLLIHADMESISMQSAGLDAENRPTVSADSATAGQSQILESTVSESSQTASATLDNETIGQSSPASQKSAASSTQTVLQTTSTPPSTTSQSRSTTAPTTTIPTTVQTTTAQLSTQPADTTKPTFTSNQWIVEILRLTNAARTGQGINPFSATNNQLAQAAVLRANELTSAYSHYRPDGSECFTALDECKVSWSTAAENIAQASAGFYTPQDIVNGWMNSPGHRANILNGDFTNIAIGYAKANGKEYFVQLFIG